ncbi:EAL domain-containing protein [Brevibacillus composti]|uniref:hypothetical protein n=1 Tax=Brevibacillus composti TaxID=2796470 RepID=UPI001E5DBB12|nr:hypothetical protein [Brevibacillus composti]
MDTLSILRAIQAFFAERLQEKKELLFVNIYPSTIIDEHFPGFIDGLVSRYRPYVKRIVLEINESILEQKIWMNPLFIRRIALLRKRGFMIALDKGEAHLILEGIEQEEDYSRAAALGVSIAQGYYLGRPGRLKSDTCNRQILEE